MPWRLLLRFLSPTWFVFFFFLIHIILCIYFCLHWVFVASRGLSLVAVSFLFVVVRGLLAVGASPVAEHKLWADRLSSCGAWAPERGVSSCGAGAQLFRSAWNPPRPGIEPGCPALAGRLLGTAPSGVPHPPVFCGQCLSAATKGSSPPEPAPCSSLEVQSHRHWHAPSEPERRFLCLWSPKVWGWTKSFPWESLWGPETRFETSSRSGDK